MPLAEGTVSAKALWQAELRTIQECDGSFGRRCTAAETEDTGPPEPCRAYESVTLSGHPV